MKILVHVILPSITTLRGDIPNWDTFGCAEALDTEMPKYALSNFATPEGYRIGESLIDGRYKWLVDILPIEQAQSKYGTTKLPTILFWNVETNAIIGRIEGTPQTKEAVQKQLSNIFDGSFMATLKRYWWLAPLGAGAYLFFKNRKKRTRKAIRGSKFKKKERSPIGM